ncbi:HD-GYP domain-containing protein [Paenibacillus sp. FA6]|uniref:HD-GYP domain-containing protein n=1 Tax=Paenibacillus sp. FA6 TaxID=3413029 RepID=UPI003F65C6D4
MASMSVLSLKPGIKLLNDVYTPMGSLLFNKGKVLLPRDLDILVAFLVESIEVDETGKKGTPTEGRQLNREKTTITKKPSDSSSPSVSEQVSSINASSFVEEYEKMVNLIKSGYPSVVAVGIPIYEIRNQLESLIYYLKDYDLLSFSPRVVYDYDYIHHNAVLCALTSYKLAQWIGLPQKDWMQAAFAGLFHDIGNVKIDSSILYKPTSLTMSEIEEMREHTKYGYQILKNVTAINDGVRLAALQHHEKVDGTGYPMRVELTKIHIYARIVGIADIYHAMTLNKAYRKGQSPYLVLEQIHTESFGKLDPELVLTFIRKVTEFHNGKMVRLSSDQIGEIVFSNHNNPTRPMVSINGDIINLEQKRHLYIEEVINQSGK